MTVFNYSAIFCIQIKVNRKWNPSLWYETKNKLDSSPMHISMIWNTVYSLLFYANSSRYVRWGKGNETSFNRAQPWCDPRGFIWVGGGGSAAGGGGLRDCRRIVSVSFERTEIPPTNKEEDENWLRNICRAYFRRKAGACSQYDTLSSFNSPLVLLTALLVEAVKRWPTSQAVLELSPTSSGNETI